MIVNPISSKKPAKAKIIVTAPTGSTVTCDGVVGTEVSGTWEFSVNVGNHTIVATLGTKTKTETVLVDVVGEYQVEIDYKLWLYRDGDECEEVTGGWVKDSYHYVATNGGDLTKGPSSMTFTRNTISELPVIGTDKQVDLSNFETICIEADYTPIGANSSWVRKYALVITSTKEVPNPPEQLFDISSSGVHSFSIQSTTGLRYIVIALNYSPCTVVIHKIWLE